MERVNNKVFIRWRTFVRRIYLPETLSSNGEDAVKSNTTRAGGPCGASTCTNEDGVDVSPLSSVTEERIELGLPAEATRAWPVSFRDIVDEVLESVSVTL